MDFVYEAYLRNPASDLMHINSGPTAFQAIASNRRR